MYALLKSFPFTNENYPVFALFKYLAFNFMGYTNEALLLSTIRWEFMNNHPLFIAINKGEV